MSTARPQIRIWPADDPNKYIDLSPNDIISFRASAGCDSPGGDFQIEVNPRQDGHGGTLGNPAAFARLLRPRSVVSIGYDRPGGIMLGLISSVQQAENWSGSRAAVGVTITGRGFAATLREDLIVNAMLAGDKLGRFRSQVSAVLGENSPILNLFHTDLGPLSQQADPNKQVNEFTGADVTKVIQWIVSYAPSMTIPLLGRITGGKLGGTSSAGNGSIGKYLQTDRYVTTWNNSRVWTNDLQSYHGSTWGWIQAAIDIDFYEAFVDTEPSPDGSPFPRADLIVRPKPFDDKVLEELPVDDAMNTVVRVTPAGTSLVEDVSGLGYNWPSLRTRWNGREHHVLDPTSVLSYSLAWDDAEAFTYYNVVSNVEAGSTMQDVQNGCFNPVLDLYAARTFGVRPYEVATTLLGQDLARRMAADSEYDNTEFRQAIQFRNRLVNWWRFAPWMVKGTVTVKGKDEYRPGEPYFLPWAVPRSGNQRGVRAYGTNVTWSWSVGAPYLCTIQVTRGYNRACIDAAREEIERVAPADNPKMLAVG